MINEEQAQQLLAQAAAENIEDKQRDLETAEKTADEIHEADASDIHREVMKALKLTIRRFGEGRHLPAHVRRDQRREEAERRIEEDQRRRRSAV